MKYIHVFNNTANSASYVNSDKYIEPSFVCTRSRRTTDYYPVIPPISLGDIVYWDGSDVRTVTQSEWNTSLGTPIGVVVIPNKMLPDRKARMISIKAVNQSGNAVSSNYSMAWGSTSTDTSLANYDCVPTTDNAGSTSTGLSSTGVCPTDRLVSGGTKSYVDPLAGYSSSYTYNLIPSPYLGDNSTFNPEYSKAISGHNNALSDFDGLGNTQTLVGLGTGYAAANACWKYKDGVSDTQWYLPAAGELGFLAARLQTINAALSLVGGVAIGYYHNIWSSTENAIDLAYIIYTGTPNMDVYYKSNTALPRPFSIVEAKF